MQRIIDAVRELVGIEKIGHISTPGPQVAITPFRISKHDSRPFLQQLAAKLENKGFTVERFGSQHQQMAKLATFHAGRDEPEKWHRLTAISGGQTFAIEIRHRLSKLSNAIRIYDVAAWNGKLRGSPNENG